MRLHDVPVKMSSCILTTLTRPKITELVAGRPVSLPAHQAPLLPVPGPPVLLQRRVGVHHLASPRSTTAACGAAPTPGRPPGCGSSWPPRSPVRLLRPAQLQRGGGPGAGRDGAADTSLPGPGGRHHGPRHTELYIYNVNVQLFPQ